LRSRDGHITSGSESFKPGRFEGGGMRYLRFKRWLTEVKQCGSDGIDAVYFEEVRRHAGVDAAHAYGGFLAHLTAWCEHHQIPYQGVPVGTIKKHATGKGNAGKAAMIAAAVSTRVSTRRTTTRPTHWPCWRGQWLRRTQHEDPSATLSLPAGAAAADVTDLEAVKETGWREQRILVVSDTDERLDFVEREFVRRLGERLYGLGGRRHG
jgi:hypothetical protein